MSKVYNTWQPEDTAKAQGMLDAINGHSVFPHTGRNGGKTTIWAEELTEWVDGRVGFEEVPQSALDALGITEAEANGLRAMFTPIKVDADEMPLTVAQQYAIDHPDEL